jgi:uncharacterized membrane protein YeaQ/YmgE (transglycosylase-associated protein family)
MDRARAVAFLDNVVAGWVGALILAVLGSVWALYKAEPPHRVAVMALLIMAACLVIFNQVRAYLSRRRGGFAGRLEFIGLMVDGRAIYRCSDSAVEFDSNAREYFDARSAADRKAIELVIRASRKDQYSRFDLENAVKGKMPEREPVFPVNLPALGTPPRIRFYTRSEIRALPPEQRPLNGYFVTELATWSLGRGWYESLSLLKEAYDILRDRFEPAPPPSTQTSGLALGAALGAGGGAGLSGILNEGLLKMWYDRVKAHLGY